jgi:hypothetical protein
VISRGVRAKERDRVLGPVGCEDVGTSKRSRERGQPEARAELDDAPTRDVERPDDARQRDPARPELGPVREELLLVEGGLVDQLVGARWAQERQRPPRELDLLLDQRAA